MLVCTHSNTFFASELMAIAILQKAYGDSLKVIRSNSPEVWSNADILINVGKEYNLTEDKYDLGGVTEKMTRSNGTPYSICGLAWWKYGNDICSEYLEDQDNIGSMFFLTDTGLISTIDKESFYNPTCPPVITLSDTLFRFNDFGINEDAGFAKALEIAGMILSNELDKTFNMALVTGDVKITDPVSLTKIFISQLKRMDKKNG